MKYQRSKLNYGSIVFFSQKRPQFSLKEFFSIHVIPNSNNIHSSNVFDWEAALSVVIR